MFRTLKKEIALQISKAVPVRVQRGVCVGMKLYGDLFYNRRPAQFKEEEVFYERLDLAGKVMIEAGAHIGYYTLYFSRKIGDGRLFVFEPNPISYRFLCRNLRANSCTNTVAENAGLSNAPGSLRIVAKRYSTAFGQFP